MLLKCCKNVEKLVEICVIEKQEQGVRDLLKSSTWLCYSPACACVYLLSALELTNCANEHAACASLYVCVGFCVQAESVQDAGKETDVVTDLHTVPKLHQSRQVPQS